MIKASTIGVGLVLAAWAWVEPAGALAQVGPSGATTSGSVLPLPSTSTMMSNPYLYMNPYLNPGITQQPMNGNNALLFLYAANSANGGLGSGRMSGTRGGAPVRKAAEMPYTAHPGGGAARFFNPGLRTSAGAGRYYSQRGRYFQNNGH